MSRRVRSALLLIAAALVSPAWAQDQAGWSSNLTGTFNHLPDDPDYLQPTLRADRRRLHLEARYNYEDLESVSLFGGANFETGEPWTLTLTPMLGVVFGPTAGIIPALELDLAWGKLALYAEVEYVIDVADDSNHYFYTWSELSVRPVEWWRAGTVAQRTRVQRERELEPGVLVGATYRMVEGTACFFNPGGADHYTLLLVSVSF